MKMTHDVLLIPAFRHEKPPSDGGCSALPRRAGEVTRKIRPGHPGFPSAHARGPGGVFALEPALPTSVRTWDG